MHMNANEPVEVEKVKLYISADVYLPIYPSMSKEEKLDYVHTMARQLLKEEPTVNIENKQLEDVE